MSLSRGVYSFTSEMTRVPGWFVDEIDNPKEGLSMYFCLSVFL